MTHMLWVELDKHTQGPGMNHYPDFPFESFDSTATMVIFLGLGCNNYGTMVLPWM